VLLTVTSFTAVFADSAFPCNDFNAIWCDEFDIPGPPNLTLWKYDIGGGGWGNDEVQDYTSSNAYVGDDGYLHIRVTAEELDNNGGIKYTSSRIHSQGTVTFQYVTLEASIKIPDLTGGLW
jgi:beta-glucanase (GH16 family)